MRLRWKGQERGVGLWSGVVCSGCYLAGALVVRQSPRRPDAALALSTA